MKINHFVEKSQTELAKRKHGECAHKPPKKKSRRVAILHSDVEATMFFNASHVVLTGSFSLGAPFSRSFTKSLRK